MSKYRIERYQLHLQDQVVRLQEHLWGASPELRAGCLDWKYLRNPYIDQPLIYVALHDQKVVGMRGMFGSCWQAGASHDRITVPIASDLIIEPAHRGGSLFGDLNEFAMTDLRNEGYSCALNLSASPQNYMASVLTLKWRSVGSYEMMIYSAASHPSRARLKAIANRLGIGGSAATLRRRIGAVLRLDPFSSLDRTARDHVSRKGHPLRIENVARPEAMADLVERIGTYGRLRQVRDGAYFKWRFGNPLSTFRFLYWGEETVDGYLILQNTQDQPHVNIVDWEASDPEIRLNLLRTAVEWGRFQNLRVWSATLPDSAHEQLRGSGFATADDDPSYPRYSWRFLFRFVDTASDSSPKSLLDLPPLEMDSWDLRMIYSDAF